MRSQDEDEFRDFVTTQMPSLRKLAFVTCGDWQMAEDAVANAFVKLYPRRRRLERPDLYAKTMVVRAAIDEIRRPWRRSARRAIRCRTSLSKRSLDLILGHLPASIPP